MTEIVPLIPRTQRALLLVVLAIFIIGAIPAVGFTFWQNLKQDSNRVAGCAVLKELNVDGARLGGELHMSVGGRSRDPQLPLSERRRAYLSALNYDVARRRAENRIVNCEKLVHQGKRVLDEKVIRESQRRAVEGLTPAQMRRVLSSDRSLPTPTREQLRKAGL